jgi:hypothetical protein
MNLAETITEALRPMTVEEIAALSDELLAFNYREVADVDPDGIEAEAMRSEIVRRWLAHVEEPEGLI